MVHAILIAEQVWAKGGSNLQPSSLPEENAASSGVGREGSVFHLESHPLPKGSAPRAAFLPSCSKPSAEDQHTSKLYPVYSDDMNSNDAKRKEN